MLRLYIEAPFAAFRPFTAGWYRPTAAFMTPSAAYGLALNLAGVETRRDDGLSPMMVTVFDLPPARIALGAASGRMPTVQTLFQQLHNYTVGKGSKVDDPDNPGVKAYQGDIAKRRVKGNKFNITPVRREFLSDLRAIVAIDFFDRPDVEAAIRAALSPNPPSQATPRYGLPFLGDNAFLPSKIKVIEDSIEAKWFERLTDAADSSRIEGIVPNSTRLTIWIDRQDMSRTKSALYAPMSPASVEPPDLAWTHIDPPKAPNPPSKKGKKA